MTSSWGSDAGVGMVEPGGGVVDRNGRGEGRAEVRMSRSEASLGWRCWELVLVRADGENGLGVAHRGSLRSSGVWCTYLKSAQIQAGLPCRLL